MEEPNTVDSPEMVEAFASMVVSYFFGSNGARTSFELVVQVV